MLSNDEVLWYIAATSLLKLLSYFTWKNMKLKSAESKGTVSKLTLYPVKSMGGIDLREAQCTYYGLKENQQGLQDRLWMLTLGDKNQLVNANKEPRIIQVQVDISESRLHLKAPGMEPINLSTPSAYGKRIETKVYGDPTEGTDCGTEIADWFNRYLGSPDHHVLYSRTAGRLIKRRLKLYTTEIEDDHRLLFHNDGPYLLTTEASFNELIRRLPDGSAPITMENFRPTIVVHGDLPAFDEDTWDIIWIGDVRFRRMMLCGRCLLTTVDPATGVKRDDGEPLKTLKSFRVVQKNSDSPCFGIYIICEVPGVIRLDDEVRVSKNKKLTNNFF